MKLNLNPKLNMTVETEVHTLILKSPDPNFFSFNFWPFQKLKKRYKVKHCSQSLECPRKDEFSLDNCFKGTGYDVQLKIWSSSKTHFVCNFTNLPCLGSTSRKPMWTLKCFMMANPNIIYPFNLEVIYVVFIITFIFL